jgi:hypothetical protein
MKSSVNLFWDKFLITEIQKDTLSSTGDTSAALLGNVGKDTLLSTGDTKKSLILELESLMERLDEMLEAVISLQIKIN